jgi:cell division protein FtsB
MKRKIKIGLIFGFLILGLVYIFVFSSNNYKRHRELNRKIKYLDQSIVKAKNQVNNTYTFEELRNDSTLVEKFVREQLNWQKPNEDVFIFVFE